MRRVLLLNADWTPMHFITESRAIVLLYSHKVEQVSAWDDVISSPTVTMNVPAVVRLVRYVSRRWHMPRFRRRALFNRDDWTCQYCGESLVHATVTVDHVVPKSLGGQTTWQNCVTSCSKCNKRKANQTPERVGMKLRRRPLVPKVFHFWNISVGSDAWHGDWAQFFDV